jgi:hypothetical protein
MALIGLIPLLALLGVFSGVQVETAAASPSLELNARYPARLRYKTTDRIEVRVRNRSDRPLNRVVVKFDEDYISRFSNLVFTPAAQRAYEVELVDLRPGETRLLAVEIQAEQYWRHSGALTASAGDDAATVNLGTTVFP